MTFNDPFLAISSYFWIFLAISGYFRLFLTVSHYVWPNVKKRQKRQRDHLTWLNELNRAQIDPSQCPMTKGGGTAGQGGVGHHNFRSIVLDDHWSKMIYRPQMIFFCYYSSLDDLVPAVFLGTFFNEGKSVFKFWWWLNMFFAKTFLPKILLEFRKWDKISL